MHYIEEVHVQEVKHHPASVDLELIKRLAATTKCKSLQQFLYKDFSCISKDFASAIAYTPSPQAPAHLATPTEHLMRMKG